MGEHEMRKIAVVGVGLLGGSIGLAAKAHDPRIKVAGVGRRQVSLDTALEVGAIDTAHFDAAEAAEGADLVILATPVGAFREHLQAMAPGLKGDAMVTDVGSTKVAVVRCGQRVLGRGGQFVGSHPMAGSELKGPAYARADLFAGATCIVTPTGDTPPRLVARVEGFWQTLGMRTVRMTPSAHDRAIGCVSHLPHALASLLMLLPSKADLDVSATGFRDATRLAGGDPEMWRDIFLTNRVAVLGALEKFDHLLVELRDLIDRGDADGIEKFLAAAKARRANTIAKQLQDRRISAE